MSEPQRVKLPGRTKPVLAVVNGGGVPVVAEDVGLVLCWTASSQRYYIHPTDPRVYLGKDHAEAVFRFRSYVDQRRGAEPQVTFERPTTAKHLANMAKFFPHIKEPTPTTTQAFPEAEAYKFVRSQILSNPRNAAHELQIPEIERITTLPPLEPSLSMDEILKAYIAKRSSHDEKRKCTAEWKQFQTLLDAKCLADITETVFDKYRAYITNKLESDWGELTAFNAIGRLITIINHSVKRGKDTLHGMRVLGYLRGLKADTGKGEPASQPRPYSREELKTLLTTAKGTPWEVAVMLGLNCGYYGKDLARVPVAAINWDDKALVFHREKKGTVRAVILWDRTIELLRKWLSAHPSQTTVLLNANGEPYKRFGKSYYEWRKTCLGSEYTLDRLRDSLFTRALEAGCRLEEVQLIMGHRLPGKSDSYLVRLPVMTKDASAAVEAYYFGQEQKKPTA